MDKNIGILNQCCEAEIIYLFLAPAPAAAIFFHNKSSITRNMSQWRFIFILASSKLTAENIY